MAQHGTPSERNAHPAHRAAIEVIVLNGSVENHPEFEKKVEGRRPHLFLRNGHRDNPLLIRSKLVQRHGFVEAKRQALADMAGSYRVSNEKEMVFITVKKESPFVLGIGDGKWFMASDAPAASGAPGYRALLSGCEKATPQGQRCTDGTWWVVAPD